LRHNQNRQFLWNDPWVVALEFAKDNIRINTVAPAGVATDMVDRHSGKEGPKRDGFTVLHPVGVSAPARKLQLPSSTFARIPLGSPPDLHLQSMEASGPGNQGPF
jgi:NAD(P)-dependent dehydrogenase (short-subunit alcohol dehydrogenase family)